jgi:hypothetical protein
MYKSEVIDKDNVEKRIATRLKCHGEKKRKRLFHDRIIIEEILNFILSTIKDIFFMRSRFKEELSDDVSEKFYGLRPAQLLYTVKYVGAHNKQKRSHLCFSVPAYMHKS